MSPRNRELLGLLGAACLVCIGFAAVFRSPSAAVATTRYSQVSLTYGGIFLAFCLVAHLVVRWRLPRADAYLLPLVAALASVGIVMVYRISEPLARGQAVWFGIGLVLFVLTVVFLRDVHRLEQYRYTLAVAAIAAMLLPRLPLIGGQVNGAYLAIHIGSFAFQPAEFGKLAIVVFLASYFAERRELLARGGRRLLGVALPSAKYAGPALVVWGAAMLMLLATRELGTSLMFYAAFLALLYAATRRTLYVAGGLGAFALGAWLIGSHVAHVKDRVAIWLHPLAPGIVEGKGYQIAQSMFAQADGGMFGRGIGQSLLALPGGGTLVPVPESDLIYAIITDDLGLVGATALLIAYLLVVARGLKIATIARDEFSKLLAAGIAFVFGIQVFVIVGGVTRVIPLTGVPLPFVSYGGSSLVMNFVAVALLLIISDRARRPVARTSGLA